MLKVKLGKSFYTNITEFRGFISLHTVMSALEELTYDYYVSYSRAPKGKSLKEIADQCFQKYSICIGHPYKTFKEAYKNCSKICDGETERTFKVEIRSPRPEGTFFFPIALTIMIYKGRTG